MVFCTVAVPSLALSEPCGESCDGSGRVADGVPSAWEAMVGAMPLCGGLTTGPLEGGAAGIPALASAV